MINSKDIVLIDDDEDMVELYKMALEGDEIKWFVFTNGFAALDYLQHHEEVAAVILDLALPTLDGLAIVQEIRRNENMHDRAPVKIAFLTAFDETPAIRRVKIKSKVEKHWRKPMDTFELTGKVKEWLS